MKLTQRGVQTRLWPCNNFPAQGTSLDLKRNLGDGSDTVILIVVKESVVGIPYKKQRSPPFSRIALKRSVAHCTPTLCVWHTRNLTTPWVADKDVLESADRGKALYSVHTAAAILQHNTVQSWHK